MLRLGIVQETIHPILGPRRHTALLVALVGAFLVRPLVGDSGTGPLLFSVAMLILLLLALYNINVDELVGERETLLKQRKRRTIIAWTIGVLAVLERLAATLSPGPGLNLAGSLLWLVLFAFITWNELRAVLRQKTITQEVISMSISVYLLLGMTFGLLYIALHDIQPNSFSFGGSPATTLTDQQVIPVLVYFSLTTLSTIGFGDITPLTLQARYAAVTEGITGQFYLAILVARLVGIQMSHAAARHAEPKTPDSSAGD